MVSSMDGRVEASLRAAPFRYSEVGATRSLELPAGYSHLDRARNLPSDAFDEAAGRLMTWRIHETAGLHVFASSLRVEPDAVVEMFLGPRWLGIRAVCRVVYVINEPDRVGFGYGTLSGPCGVGRGVVRHRATGRRGPLRRTGVFEPGNPSGSHRRARDVGRSEGHDRALPASGSARAVGLTERALAGPLLSAAVSCFATTPAIPGITVLKAIV